MKEGKKGFKPFLGLTFLIGFGFFTMGLMDPLYDTYVPIFLGKILKRMDISSNALIGFIMTFDNILAVFLIPVVSLWSDNVRTRIGRRKPFIAVLLPLSAVCFSLLPFAGSEALPATRALIYLLLVIFGLNIFKQSVRGPIVALMPDTIPGEYRSEANGIINTMGAIGAIIGTAGLSKLLGLEVILPLIGSTKGRLPFLIAGALVVVATILVVVFVRERSRSEEAAEKKVPILESLRSIAGEKDKSALWILLSLFFWFFGYNGIVPFVGKLCTEVLKTSDSDAALPAAAVGIAQALFAIPSGYIAHRIGRRKAIRGALLVLIIILGLAGFLVSPAGQVLSPKIRFIAFLSMMFLYGIFWIIIITNSFPMLWQMASFGTIGIYTGLYYTFSQAAAISSPPIAGALIDFIGHYSIFVFAACSMLIAFFIMGKVRSGEPESKKA